MKIFPTLIVLVIATLTTAVAGYRYLTQSDRDDTVQTTFAGGNFGTHEKFETFVRGGKDSRVAGRNGLDSLEPTNIDTSNYFPR